MSAQDPILAAACRRVGCGAPAQDRHHEYCSERCRKRDQDGGNGDTLVGDGGRWPVSDPVDLDDIVPLDMANNITDERVRQRITWTDGFGRAYADALSEVVDDE